MSTHSVPTSSVPAVSHLSWKAWAGIAAALLLIRTLSWAVAELWYDEVLSLELFILRPDSFGAVFRSYSIANNHMLANAIQWLWVRLPGFNLTNEYLLRLPSLIYGMTTIAVVVLVWKKWLGEKLSCGVGILMALSPVFAAFAYQMRGYSLAMLLGTVAVTCAQSRQDQPTLRNAAGLFLSSLLLPFVMPTAAMLPCALAVALAANAFFSQKQHWINALQQALPALAGAFLGTAYYLTLWEAFRGNASSSGGWTSAWLVAGNVLLGFLAHLGVLSITIIFALNKLLHYRRTPLTTVAKSALWLLAGSLLAIIVILLLPSPIHRSPFPRVFLVLLPAVTFAVARLASEWRWLTALSEPRLMLLLAAPAVLIGYGSDALTARQLETPHVPPQNLLQQYYRGKSPCRLALYELTRQPADDNERRIVAVNAYDFTAFSFYWQFTQLPQEHPNNVPVLLPGNQLVPAMAELFRSGGYQLTLFARTPDEARSLLKSLGLPEDSPLTPLGARQDHRSLYSVKL